MNIELSKLHKISPYLFMQFMEPLGTADSSIDAGWDFLHEKWQPKLLNIVKDLSPTMIRFGGCFASYYHWYEAVGPRSNRKTIFNLCWDGLYSNQVGTAEIVDFCSRVGAQPLMVVNMESDGRMKWAYPKEGENRFGTSREAAEWVDYCNNPDNKLRRAHGFEDPFNIKYWQIGNETSYDKSGYSAEQCADATLRFSKSMKSIDKTIKTLAWCDSGWADTIIEKAGDDIDIMAFHYHFGYSPENSTLYGTKYREDFEITWKYLMSAAEKLDKRLSEMKDSSLKLGKPIAMTEGHFSLKGRNRCEVLSTWAAGVSYARCMIVQEKYSDVLEISTLADFFGNRWQVNAVMLPTPYNSGNAYLMPVGKIMKLFRHHIGEFALKVNDIPHDVDCYASITNDENKIFIHLVNTNIYEKVIIPINIKYKNAIVYEISDEPEKEITELSPDIFEPIVKTIIDNCYTMPPASVSVIEIVLK